MVDKLVFQNPPLAILNRFDRQEQQLLKRLVLQPEHGTVRVYDSKTGSTIVVWPKEWLEDSDIDLFADLEEKIKNRYVSSRDLLRAALDGEI